MSTSAKAQKLANSLADVFRKRLSLTVTEGFDASSDGPHATILLGTGVAGTETAFIRAKPVDWPLSYDIVGHQSRVYAPTVLQLVTEQPQAVGNTRMVRLATAAALAACTAAGAGVGKTLTGNANGALSIDGVACAANDVVLIKNQVAGADNGIYRVTTVGDAGAAFVLTRATTADQNAEWTPSMTVTVLAGSTLAGQVWKCTNTGAITVDTTALTFAVVAAGTQTALISKATEMAIIGTLTQTGAVVEWYVTAAGTAPSVAGITGAPAVTFDSVEWPVMSAQ